MSCADSRTIEAIKAQVLPSLLAALPELRALYLFGSHASGSARPESDIDLAIDAGHALPADECLELALELAQRLDRELDLVDLRSASAVLRREILTNGVRLYVAAPVAEQDALEAAWLTEYLDLAFIRREQLADIQREGRIHG